LSDRTALLDAFARGTLVRPSTEHTCFVDVVRAVAHASGVPVDLNDHSRDLATHLRQVDHLVFFLADGLGINLVDQMPRGSWIRQHTLRAIHAPFPSTTTTAVTSLATAAYPAEHAVCGWWIHLPQVNGPVTVFAHDRAEDGHSLHALGIEADALCEAPPIIETMTRDAALVVPAGIADSPYTVRMAGSRPRIASRSYGEAAEAILQRVEQASGPTFTYWYTASPDTEAHDEGPRGQRVAQALEQLDEMLATLAAGLQHRTDSWRIIGTADHGHLELDPHLELEVDDEILDLLRCAPAGDMRVQYWHVRPGSAQAFEERFRARLGEMFFLLTAEEAEALQIFGPEPWSALMRERSGDYVSLARGSASLRYAGIPGGAGYRRMRSGHSGLSPEEMRIPLIIGGEGPPRGDYGG
jgi:predicted AlkP superfamily pyrophosphatase or phosphodiesterase